MKKLLTLLGSIILGFSTSWAVYSCSPKVILGTGNGDNNDEKDEDEDEDNEEIIVTESTKVEFINTTRQIFSSWFIDLNTALEVTATQDLNGDFINYVAIRELAILLGEENSAAHTIEQMEQDEILADLNLLLNFSENLTIHLDQELAKYPNFRPLTSQIPTIISGINVGNIIALEIPANQAILRFSLTISFQYQFEGQTFTETFVETDIQIIISMTEPQY